MSWCARSGGQSPVPVIAGQLPNLRDLHTGQADPSRQRPALGLSGSGSGGLPPDRRDLSSSVLSSITNCGVIDHPLTGPADLVGPADPADNVDAEALRLLLREIYAAAGGTHDDLDEYNRSMVAGDRTAVLVSPDCIIGNAPTT